MIRHDVETRTIRMGVRDLLLEWSGSPQPSALPASSMSALGRKAHTILQDKKIGQSPFYAREVAVHWEMRFEDYRFIVEGRADLVYRKAKRLRVEEIKSVAVPVSRFKSLNIDDYPDFQWQTRLYTYFLSLAEPDKLPSCAVILVNLRSRGVRKIPVDFDRADVARYLERNLATVLATIARREAELAEKRVRAEAMAFPLGEDRPGQRRMMEEVARTLDEGERLLVSAPTGTGKTAGALYPAVKHVLSTGRRLFALSGKNTQKSIVEQTVKSLQEAGAPVKTLLLASSASLCVNSVHFCDPSVCTFAAQHRSRMAETSVQDLFADPLMTPDKVRNLGIGLGVCPFALSLSLAMSADVVACDYNYVFDPGVYLRRFFFNRDYTDCVLVIDEAHSLYDRARQSFSPELKRRDFQALVKSIGPRRKGVHGALRDLFGRIEDALAEYQRQGEIDHPEQGMYLCDLDVDFWSDTAEEMDLLFLDYLMAEMAQGGIRQDDPVAAASTAVKSFGRMADLSGTDFRFLYRASHGGVLKIFCCDPSRLLGYRMAGFHAVVAMSATLEPFRFYQDVLGMGRSCRTLSVPSPFPPENRLFVIADSISTRFKDRMKSYDAVAKLIMEVMAVHPGNYLAFFPSFEYLQAVRLFLGRADCRIVVQKSSMAEAERSAVLKEMAQNQRPILLMAVSGGVFSEGVDFTGDMAVGAFIVGPALPSLSPEQELLRDYYDSTRGAGFDYAYIYPGMNKVIQAAGRVIRTGTDKGVVVLIDDRFSDLRYRKLFPEHWYDRDSADLVAEDPVERVRRFWEGS